jgi:hypothetical protein
MIQTMIHDSVTQSLLKHDLRILCILCILCLLFSSNALGALDDIYRLVQRTRCVR